MEKKIKILHVTEKLQAGGIENFIMNIYRNIDREKLDFNFMVTRNENEFFEEEIKQLGGKKFVIDSNKSDNVFKRVLKEAKQLEKFLKENKYDVVHVHSGTPLRIFYLRAAKRAKVTKRIYHSHSAEVKGPHSGLKIKKVIFKLLRNLFPIYATNYFACSQLAAEWMYPKKIIRQQKVVVINNGIDIQKFKYNEEIRKQYREFFNIEDKKVIGHIGRFNHQKNHTFLIDIFKKIYDNNKEYVLLLLGDGELRKEIENKVKDLNIEDGVKFLGVRDDVEKVMQAMDLFLLPSNYEGLPVVGIEAQASGLPMICSDNITKEVCITDNVKLISLEKSAEVWSEKIIDVLKKFERKDTSDVIRDSEYDIEDVAKKIERIYGDK